MYLAQIWFNLSDEDVEDAIYDSYYLETRAELILKNLHPVSKLSAFSKPISSEPDFPNRKLVRIFSYLPLR